MTVSEICLSVILYITNPQWTTLKPNPVLRNGSRTLTASAEVVKRPFFMRSNVEVATRLSWYPCTSSWSYDEGFALTVFFLDGKFPAALREYQL